MAINIFVPADETWSCFQNNRKRMADEMVLIAENTDTEYAVYLTSKSDLPFFSVCKGDKAPEYEEGAVSAQDCYETYKRICLKYLFPVTVGQKKEPDKKGVDYKRVDPNSREYDDYKFDIDIRDLELLEGFKEFLGVVWATDTKDIDALVSEDDLLDALDEVLMNLADLGIEIYRPMIIVDEDNKCEVFVEYPYD